MAKMHSDGRGESGSSNPVNKKVPEWTDYDDEEVVDLVLKLREDGLKPSEIGIELRDSYGIPDVKTITGMKITEILEEEGKSLEIPEDLQNLLDKAESIERHLDENPKDRDAERNLKLTEAKIRKVAEHHRENGKLEEDWKYERED